MHYIFSMEVVAIIFIQKHRALITRRPPQSSLANQWEFPGGKVKAGEDLRQALVREIDEELKVQVQKDEPVYVGQVSTPKIQLHFFYQNLSSPYFPQEHPATAWLSHEELLRKSLCPADLQAMVDFTPVLKPLLTPSE